MNDMIDLIVRAAPIGIGATALLDLWALMLNRFFGIPPANWAMVGRWIGHFPRGRFVHASIAAADPVAGERSIGWAAHYLIGVGFAVLLLAVYGRGWASDPTLIPALIFGLATVIAPFFLMQPAMGSGIAASKAPNPGAARARSVASHLVFGIGLFAAAWGGARIWDL